MSDAYSGQEDRFSEKVRESLQCAARGKIAQEIEPKLSHWEDIQMQLEKLNALASDLANLLSETKENLLGPELEGGEVNSVGDKPGRDCYVDAIKGSILRTQALVSKSMNIVHQIRGE